MGMSPRKKSKPNPKAPADGSNNAAHTPTSTPSGSGLLCNTPSSRSIAESSSNGTATPAASCEMTLNKKASRKWLGGSGSWRSKAPAVAKIAKESIGVSGGATSELADEEARKDDEPSPRKLISKRKSSKGDAIPASMTKLNVSSNGSIDQVPDDRAQEAVKEPTEAVAPGTDEPPLPPEPPKSELRTESTGTFGWRSWWSRPDGYTEPAKAKVVEADEASRTPLPRPSPSEEVDRKTKELGGNSTEPSDGQDTEMKDAPNIAKAHDQNTDIQNAPPAAQGAGSKNASVTSWFWLWSNAQNAQTNPSPTATTTSDKVGNTHVAGAPAPETMPPELTTQAPPVQPVPPTTQQDAGKPSGWAFWFRDKSQTNNKPTEGPHKQVGEVAVFDTPSQSHPEVAQFNEQGEQPKQALPKLPGEESITKKSFRSLRGRPKGKGTPVDTPSSSKAVTPAKTSPAPSPTRPEAAPTTQPAAKPVIKTTKQEPPNLILPEFRNTYQLVQRPSYWQQIRQYFLGGEPAIPHLHINPAPPRIKKAIAIGVHGFFPAPIFQKVLGQPTGTSVRFANAAAAAINEWTEAHGYTTEIEQIALEGEGFIAERVNTLWKLLLNWIESIKQADFILVACHSQGVPVAIMLVAKLIQFGCVNAARIGVCAMAGVNMGPFIEYRTKYFGQTAAELFEFSNPKSLVSQMYLAALDEALRYGVRILYVGSIDDQLVSLESSTFSTLSHPYIYRAVFVDGRIHVPDFLTHLVGFAMKLRNLGMPDHGLIRELSPALAGSLYAGEGHSRVYEDPRVYQLAVQHALETTSLPIQPQQRPSSSASLTGINIPVIGAPQNAKDPYALRVKDYDGAGSANQNPYYLPWAMRGLLEEDFVKRELGQEVEELLAMFESWKPTSKGLKDVKFRLEGVRSKL